jgi:hypothetical protein
MHERRMKRIHNPWIYIKGFKIRVQRDGEGIHYLPLLVGGLYFPGM